GVVACRGVGVACDSGVCSAAPALEFALPPRAPVWGIGYEDVGGYPFGDLAAVAEVERDVIVAPVGGGHAAVPSVGSVGSIRPARTSEPGGNGHERSPNKAVGIGLLSRALISSA